MKRCPSFSNRPGFPRGLRVLVLEVDEVSRDEAETQLSQCGYSPVVCSSIPDTLVHLASGPSSDKKCQGDQMRGTLSWDLLMADLSFISPSMPDSSSLIAASRSLPVILTHQGSPSSYGDLIMAGVKQGAVDFLEKPLNPHKLKNIWQHTVRKMMGGDFSNTSGKKNSKGSQDHSVQKSTHSDPSHFGGHQHESNPSTSDGVASCGHDPSRSDALRAKETSHDSGSNTSSSEQAHPPHGSSVMDMMMEMDLDTSYFLDAFDKDQALPLSELFMEGMDLLPDQADLHIRLSFPPPGSQNGGGGGSAPLLGAGLEEASKGSEGLGSGGAVIGHSAGQLPPLPPTPGIVWGLPVQPLKIAPKLLFPPMPMMGMGMPPFPPFAFPPLPPSLMNPGPGGRAMTPPPWMMMGMPPPMPPPPAFMMGMGLGMPPLPFPYPVQPFQRPGTPPLPPFPVMGMPPPLLPNPSLPPPPVMLAPPPPPVPLPASLPAPQGQKQHMDSLIDLQSPPFMPTTPSDSPPMDGLSSDFHQISSVILDDSALIDMNLSSMDMNPIGLSLRKTGSFLDLISENLSSGGHWSAALTSDN